MINDRYWLRIGTIFFTFLLLFSSTCSCVSSNSEVKTKEPVSNQNLGLLYLSHYYLIPYKPGDDNANKTALLANNQSIFSHSVYDRKFNKNIIPELNLWLDDNSKAGLELEFEVIVQAVEQSTVVQGKSYKMVFKNYTTTGYQGPKNVKIEFINYFGEPFDIKYGENNWANIALVIKRIDNESVTKLQIYHGANGKASYIKLPWNQTLSREEYESEKDKNDTPGFEAGIAFIGIIILVIILIFLNRKTTS